jgi:hypothetical protein
VDALPEEVAPDGRSVVQPHLLEAQSQREGDTGSNVLPALEEDDSPEGEAEKNRIVPVASARLVDFGRTVGRCNGTWNTPMLTGNVHCLSARAMVGEEQS